MANITDLSRRVEEMLPAAEQDKVAASTGELGHWIEHHAAAVRTIGQTNRMMAHVSAYRVGLSAAIECTFIGRLGEAYTVSIEADGEHDLSRADGHALDLVAAMSAIGALLAELGMVAGLR